MDAIVLSGVTKHFRKHTLRRDYTTLKSELVRLFTRKKRDLGSPQVIQALKGVDLRIPQGRTLGIIGRNGSGKSTLLKLITGIYTPSTGSIEVNGRISALLDLGAGFHPDFTGRENILINGIILGMTRAEIKAKTPEIIEFSELGEFIDEPVRTYSSGMYMRLAFAVATHVDPEILIIDEILAVGDEHFQKKSLAKMNEFKKAGKTIVLVTHDLGSVQRWCDEAAWVDGGKIRMQGLPSQVTAEYLRAVAIAEEQAGPPGAPVVLAAGEGLPELEPAPAPERGPMTDASRRRGNYRVEIESLDLLPAHGQQGRVFCPEDSLQVEMTLHSRSSVSPIRVEVSFVRDDGLRVYRLETAVSAPSSMGGEASHPIRLRLALPRLGLGAGNYFVDVAVRDPQGILFDGHYGLYSLIVGGLSTDGAAVCPSHHWTILPPPRAFVAASN